MEDVNSSIIKNVTLNGQPVFRPREPIDREVKAEVKEVTLFINTCKRRYRSSTQNGWWRGQRPSPVRFLCREEIALMTIH